MQGRIAKFLAHAGVCSRRQAEELVREGRVSVNRLTIQEVGFKLTGGEKVYVDGKEVILQESPPRVWEYHKPAGCIVSEKDEKGRTTIFDNIKSLKLELPRLISVGRLDYNSEGLLLLTDSGALARLLELPSLGVERHYRVRVHGKPNNADLEKLKLGMEIDGIQYRGCDVEIEDNQPPMASNLWLRMILQEGKNREIRKLFEALGMQVSRLIRIRYGGFSLQGLEQNNLREVKNPQNKLKGISGVNDLFQSENA